MASLTARSISDSWEPPRVIFWAICQYGWVTSRGYCCGGDGRVGIFARPRRWKPFRSVGGCLYPFASKEPQLFQLLFQNPSKDPIRRFLQDFLPWRIIATNWLWSDCCRPSLTSRRRRSLVPASIYLLTRDGLNGCFGIYQFSMEEVIDHWWGLSISLIKEMVGKKWFNPGKYHKSYGQTVLAIDYRFKIRMWSSVLLDRGKSTLLNVIRLRKVDEGHILIQDKIYHNSRMLNWILTGRRLPLFSPAVLSIAESNG